MRVGQGPVNQVETQVGIDRAAMAGEADNVVLAHDLGEQLVVSIVSNSPSMYTSFSSRFEFPLAVTPACSGRLNFTRGQFSCGQNLSSAEASAYLAMRRRAQREPRS